MAATRFAGLLLKQWIMLSVLLISSTAWSQESEPASLLETDTRALAVQIAYRIDLELDPVDAAQRHLLAARLLWALQTDELGPSDTLPALWLAWESRLEQYEMDRSRIVIPAWFDPLMPDAWDSVIESVYPQQSDMMWMPDLWARGSASAALLALTAQSEDRLLPISLFEPALAWARSWAPWIWLQLLEELAQEPEWSSLTQPLIQGWLAAPLDASADEWGSLDDAGSQAIASLTSQQQEEDNSIITMAVDQMLADQWPQPIEYRWLQEHVYSSFLNQDDGPEHQISTALARAILGVDEGRYAELTETLLASGWLWLTKTAVMNSNINGLLGQLERLDAWLLPQIERVDPRLLTAYQQTRRLLREISESESSNLPGRYDFMRRLAQIQAAVSLDATDLDGYLTQPARESINQELVICFSLSRQRDPLPPQIIDVEQYQRCLTDLQRWVESHAATTELTGQPSAGFISTHLQRELELDPWQRVAYWYGYLEEQTDQDCGLEDQVINPIEWVVAARALTWFIERWPAYADENTLAVVEQLLVNGQQVLQQQASLRQCVDPETLRPASAKLLAAYETTLDQLIDATDNRNSEFKTTRLRGGADVDVYKGLDQDTAYRPESLVVVPCDDETTCGMKGELEASRALFGLFPDSFLIADQVQMGNISLCYDQVEWVDRRAVKPQVRNQAMANYHGKLRFVLRGIYSELRDPVFEMQLTSREEYEYLFGENSETVLNDSCPSELVDMQVVSELPERRFQLVPRRLTYMTAERTHPSVAFDQHWATGSEWRDWFVDGRDVEMLSQNDPQLINDALQQQLNALAVELSANVYAGLLNQDLSLDESGLATAMLNLELSKRSLAATTSLLYSRSLQNDPALRASFYGEDTLFDRASVQSLQRENVPVDQISLIATGQFRDVSVLWQNLIASKVDDMVAETDPAIVRTMLKLQALRQKLSR